MRYYIADCHFYHDQLNTMMDKRGFRSVEEMNDYMLKQWNSKVKKNDEVVILGDLSLGTPEQTNELLKKLNGRLYMILGNHDRFLKNKSYDTSRFVWIKPYEELHDNGRKVILCHYPIMCYNGQYRTNKKGGAVTYMLYCHVHDTTDQRILEQFQDITRNTQAVGFDGMPRNINCNMINCFCKYSDYIPLSLDEWIERDKKRRE